MAKRILDQRWPWLVAAGVIVIAFLSTVVEINPQPERSERPVGSAEDILALRERGDVNVLFILIDTLRADRLGSYGYGRPTSPALDRFASEGVRFARNLSQSSWTKTSMASLWTGLYPARAGITRFSHILPEVARMPAEVFKGAGYRTAGIYRNGWVAPTFGFGQGFEIYQKSISLELPSNAQRENPTISSRSTDEAAIRSAIEFVRLRGDDRWFLYVHLMDLHEYIYDVESAKFGSTYSDVYDNSILWMDRTLEIFFDQLESLGALDNTIVVIGSDHGEAFSERGFEGHARHLYRETTEVPLLIRFPFKLDPGIVVEARSRNVDIWPTVLDLVGLDDGLATADTENAVTRDGVSRVPEILAAVRGEPAPERPDQMAIAQLDQNWAKPDEREQFTMSVVDGTLRMVLYDLEGGRREQLLDSAIDPRELRSAASQRPDDLERLVKIADEHLAQPPAWEIPTRELSELELGQLRALGYAVE